MVAAAWKLASMAFDMTTPVPRPPLLLEGDGVCRGEEEFGLCARQTLGPVRRLPVGAAHLNAGVHRRRARLGLFRVKRILWTASAARDLSLFELKEK